MAGKIKVHAGLDYDLKGRTSIRGKQRKTGLSNQSS